MMNSQHYVNRPLLYLASEKAIEQEFSPGSIGSPVEPQDIKEGAAHPKFINDKWLITED